MKKVLFILGQLSDQDVEWMARSGEKRKVAAGDRLIVEGQPIDAMYMVLDGVFTVQTEATRGDLIARLGAGEIVGEMSFVDARPPSASVRAAEDSVVLVLPRTDLEARLRQDQGFAARFYLAIAVFLSDRLRAVTATLGYGKPPTGDHIFAADGDDLDDNVLANIHLAGSRFDRLLKRLLAD